MIKLNRIGYKLGLAGAVGILLAGGMVANHMMSEWAVEAANSRADRSQRVIDAAIVANLNGRQIELAARNIRLATKAAEVEKNVADIARFKAAETKALEDAEATAAMPATKERLAKIKSLMASYAAGTDELAKAQATVLAQIDKRSAISSEWTKAIETQLASPALAKLDNKLEIEKLLHGADAKVNSLRAMVWRLTATGDTGLIAQITKTQAALKANFNLLRGEADDRELLVVISSLDSIVKRFLAANDEVVKTEELKADIIANRTVKYALEASALMDSQIDVSRKNYVSSKEEAAAETDRASRVGLGMGAVVIIALFASMVFSFLGISRPMMRLNGALGKMAGGNLDVVIPGAKRGDEIGDLAKTVTIIRENAEQKARDEAETKIRQDQIAARQRKAEMVKLADSFETAVGEIVEQLSSSVSEISRQVQESARMANAAVDQARTTNDRVSELSKAAARIGDVVELINSIAEQTNLLALNATIEAARAGEAGRGFAVVASEVKALAEQTSKATGEIGQQITGIQAATQDSVNAIKEISGTIGRISEISSTVASAVEEQGAATQEISRNVQQAAHGTQQVSANITDVQRGASETGSASTQVLSAAQSLSGDSNRLKIEVDKFLNSVRAA